MGGGGNGYPALSLPPFPSFIPLLWIFIAHCRTEKAVATAKPCRPAPLLKNPRHRWAARERQEGWTIICPL